MTTLKLILSEKQKAQIRRIAKKEGKSMSEVIREALKSVL